MPLLGALLVVVTLTLGSVPLAIGSTSAAPSASSRATVEGVVRLLAAESVGHDDEARTSHRHTHVYDQVLVADNGRSYFLKGNKKVANNKRVDISGLVTGGALETSEVTVLGAAPLGLATTGTTDVLVMLVNWTEPDSVTAESAAETIFEDGNGWYRDVSYGATGQTGEVTEWMDIAGPANGQCYADHAGIMSQAKSAAASAHPSDPSYLDRFDNFVVYCPAVADSDCSGLAGWAYVGAQGTWLNGNMTTRAIVHEEGHNYGLVHSHSLTCASAFDDCIFDDVGHEYDAMGYARDAGHFNASQKDLLGWMGARTRDLTDVGGTVTIAPVAADPVSAQAVVVRVTPDRSYWLEYRQRLDSDSALPISGTDGVLVHVRDRGLSRGDSDRA